MKAPRRRPPLAAALAKQLSLFPPDDTARPDRAPPRPCPERSDRTPTRGAPVRNDGRAMTTPQLFDEIEDALLRAVELQRELRVRLGPDVSPTG